jgi:hypothetical protein
MGFRDDGQYTQITNGTTVLATATDGSVRQIILGVSGFSAGLTTGREVMTGADGNQMDTESFLASLHVLTTNDIKDRGNTIVAAGKEVPFRLVTQQYGKGIVSGSKSLTDATGVCYLGLDITHLLEMLCL